MSWLTKWFPSGSESGNQLALKIRLTRWRHFLFAQRACLEGLADLREKIEEEYIFDRQYIHSALGLIFQNAFQSIYDQGILLKNQGTESYDWLDRLQEQTQIFTQNNALISKLRSGSGNSGTADQKKVVPDGEDERSDPETEDWSEEPEYRMIRSILAILDPQEKGPTSGPDSSSKKRVQDLREGLHHMHDLVLSGLFPSAESRRWIEKGSARQETQLGSTPIFSINLEQGFIESKTDSRNPTGSGTGPTSSIPWTLFSKALSLSNPLKAVSLKSMDSTLLQLSTENSFFLSGIFEGRKMFLDVMLTSIRELNHFFFRLEKDREIQTGEPLTRLFDWTYKWENRIWEIGLFRQTTQEMESHLKVLGQGLSDMVGKEN